MYVESGVGKTNENLKKSANWATATTGAPHHFPDFMLRPNADAARNPVEDLPLCRRGSELGIRVLRCPAGPGQRAFAA